MALPPQVISPLDGRYFGTVHDIGDSLSEAGLNRARVKVELEWLIHLCQHELLGAKRLDDATVASLRAVVDDFGQADIDWLKERERVTRHDVKAVEYYVRDVLRRHGLEAIEELAHITCTSEDVNNLSYALTVKDAVERTWLPKARGVVGQLADLARAHRDAAMLARTHGQPATPTTMGKELAVFAHRLTRVLTRIEGIDYLGKFSGATATFSAHVALDPSLGWPTISREFVEGLGLSWNPLTTQIESHDWMADLFALVSHANRIAHNLATDIWTYISLGYFTQIPQAGATGSSTMPHKINPIRFENAEANLELSCAVLDSLAATLVTSRMQRDLTDSSAQRNIGVGFAHSLLALDNLSRGLTEISLNEEALAADLDGNWEVLGEAIQTVIRGEIVAGRSSISDPYAVLKELTRGRRVGEAELREFVRGLDIGEDAKARLGELTPAGYTGLAAKLVDQLG